MVRHRVGNDQGSFLYSQTEGFIMLKSIAIAASVLTVATATQIYVTSPNAVTTASVVVEDRFTTVEMLDGIVFNRGEVAEDLGIVVGLPSAMGEEEVADYGVVVETLQEAMLKRDAVALDVAREQMTSGDPYQVEAALSTYRDSFNAALDAEYPDAREGVSPIAPMCGAIAVCGAVAVAAIALGAAVTVVTVNIAGGVNVIYLENGLWDENTFTSTLSTPANPGADHSVPQGLNATDTVRFLTVNLAEK